MKSFAKVMVVLSLFLCCLEPVVWAGNEIGNGGDDDCLSFSRTANWIAERLLAIQLSDPGVDAQKFKDTVSHFQIASTDNILLLNGVEKDAINYPSTQKIIFNRQRWNEAIKDNYRSVGLVTHEVLGLMSIDDASYKLSSRIAYLLTGNGSGGANLCMTKYQCQSTALHFPKADMDKQIVFFGVESQEKLNDYAITHQLGGQTYSLHASLIATCARAGKPDSLQIKYSQQVQGAVWDAAAIFIEDQAPPTFTIPLLRTISLPDGSSVSFSLRCERTLLLPL